MEALQDTQVFCKFCVMTHRGTEVSEEKNCLCFEMKVVIFQQVGYHLPDYMPL
jgi:hypothetical protein